MPRSSQHLIRRDPARALFLCLMVLVQLLLPTAFTWAQSSQADTCVTAGNGGAGKSPAHDHTQQCAHCRPEALNLAAPVAHPRISVVIVGEVAAQNADHAIIEVLVRPLPPPTGPPIAAIAV